MFEVKETLLASIDSRSICFIKKQNKTKSSQSIYLIIVIYLVINLDQLTVYMFVKFREITLQIHYISTVFSVALVKTIFHWNLNFSSVNAHCQHLIWLPSLVKNVELSHTHTYNIPTPNDRDQLTFQGFALQITNCPACHCWGVSAWTLNMLFILVHVTF